MEKKRNSGILWMGTTAAVALLVWEKTGDPFARLPLQVSPQLLGIGGWALVGLGFFAVALTALLGPRGRERRPSLWPFRPQAMFGLPVRHRKKH